MDHQTNSRTFHLAEAILEQMPVAVAVYDVPELRLLEANQLFVSIMERFLAPHWHQGRLIGHPLSEWAHPESMPRLVPILQAVADTGTPYQAGEFAFPTSDGTPTYWNWTVQRLSAPDGQTMHLLQTLTEVTAHVLARQHAEQREGHLRQANHVVEVERQRLALIDTVAERVRASLDIELVGKAALDAIQAAFHPLALYIHAADPTQHAFRLLQIRTPPGGESIQALLQRVPTESPLWLARACKGRDPLVIADLPAALASGFSLQNPSLMPLISALQVQSYVCVPLWCDEQLEGALTAVFSIPIHATGPEVQTLVGCRSHIAAALAHARLHSAVAHQRARLRTILDQLPEGMLLVEAADGCISYANAVSAELLGLPLSTLPGLPLGALLESCAVIDAHGEPLPSEAFPAARGLRGETVSGCELRVSRADGRRLVLWCAAVPLRSAEGALSGVVVVLQDITARKSLEQEKNAFLSLVSHELRTPLTAVQGNAELLQMLAARGGRLDAEPTLRILARLSDQSQRLERLTDELLDLTRLEHARLVVNRAPADLLQILTQVVESQAATTSQHHLSLVLDGLPPGQTLPGCVDEYRIEQVMSNLIGNAIKYSPAGGEIEVGIRVMPGDSPEVVIWVKDQGIGIPQAELSRIFERFHRASTRERSITGLGIGLYLVKEVVKLHGGQVWAESSPGAGATFFVQLPLVP
jgi:PAS domain S-box-containing protein